ncbi:MAG: hypothetical protein CVU20_08940 [Betaproteobacteria bacterium HGW-Betaproteobacteria-14]|nr:MAG: hypothetical protein CVU20_08940 [Betaproteobacteria bacterium HGW-Betaproteobacteria-14]
MPFGERVADRCDLVFRVGRQADTGHVGLGDALGLHEPVQSFVQAALGALIVLQLQNIQLTVERLYGCVWQGQRRLVGTIEFMPHQDQQCEIAGEQFKRALIVQNGLDDGFDRQTINIEKRRAHLRNDAEKRGIELVMVGAPRLRPAYEKAVLAQSAHHRIEVHLRDGERFLQLRLGHHIPGRRQGGRQMPKNMMFSHGQRSFRQRLQRLLCCNDVSIRHARALHY